MITWHDCDCIEALFWGHWIGWDPEREIQTHAVYMSKGGRAGATRALVWVMMVYRLRSMINTEKG